MGSSKRHAKVLRQVADGRTLRYAGARSGLSGPNPLAELLRANILTTTGSDVVFSEDTAFSLCLDDVPTAPTARLEPQVRSQRARYAVNRQQRSKPDSPS
jgi:hypothetical protein